jgi:hypothetical protein
MCTFVGTDYAYDEHEFGKAQQQMASPAIDTTKHPVKATTGT